jgi:ribonucleoside-diphosphate reductase beta chain
MTNLFEKRVAYKPFEYNEVIQFINAINKSFWVHSEIDFTADLQDFKTNLNDHEREVVKRSLLGIAQVEVGVKTFWC